MTNFSYEVFSEVARQKHLLLLLNNYKLHLQQLVIQLIV